MYEERNSKFTLRDIILQILFIALFVFLLVWLFPTKGFVNKKVDPLLDTIFNMNINSMKDAAKSYYTLSRLPQNVGDKTKMTLRQMLAEKIILPFTDKYGESCDLDASYVEITKEEDEYIMKINLKCSQQEDYILVHMGCYDYCSTTICENKDKEIVDKNNKPVTPVVSEPKKYICKVVDGKYYDKNGNVVSEADYKKSCTTTPTKYICKVVNGKYYDKNGNVVSEADYKKSCEPTSTTYICKVVDGKYYGKDGKVVTSKVYKQECEAPITYKCKYVKKEDGYYTAWSAWSDWTTDKLTVSNSSLEQVETKSETKTEEREVLIGYNIVKYYDGTKPIKQKYQVVAQKKVQTVCDRWGTKQTTTTTGTKKYVGETYLGVFTSTKAVASTDTDRYELVSIKDIPCDANCTVKTIYTYKWYAKTYEVTYEGTVSSSGTECLHTYQKVTPIYGTINVVVGYEISERKDPVYETKTYNTTVTYYRNRTRKFVNGTSEFQWSTCDNKDLLNNGWVFTGDKEPAN